MRKRVIIESPHAGNVERNESYARACMLDSLWLGEAPLASHLLYTQVLDDADAQQREVGIESGFAWHEAAELVAVYEDLGISSGMTRGIEWATKMGVPIEHRFIGGKW